MPQLGMTQDSGVIVSWLKAVGHPVAEGEALFEVETDKATMEVEAPVQGYLTGVRAREGDDVPVGDVIALIVENSDEVAAHASTVPAETKPDPDLASEPERTAQPEPEPHRPPEPLPPTAPPVSGTKVLASAKAKRIAFEQGIDLMQLRAQGMAEPIHAADLAKAATGAPSILTALVRGDAFNALLERSQEGDRTRLLAAIAAGAWRGLFDTGEARIAVRILGGSSGAVARGRDQAAAMTLVDLCDGRLASYAPAAGGVTLSVARQAGGFLLTLSFGEGALALPNAAALLEDIAARVEDPIRQLL